MTAGALIAMADELAPNAFSQSVKVMELNRIENRVRLDVLLQDPDEVEPIRAEELNTTSLVLGENYRDVYLFWMKATYYFHMGEYDTYQNEKAMFEAAWLRLCRDECEAHHQGTGYSEYGRTETQTVTPETEDADGEEF